LVAKEQMCSLYRTEPHRARRRVLQALSKYDSVIEGIGEKPPVPGSPIPSITIRNAQQRYYSPSGRLEKMQPGSSTASLAELQTARRKKH